MNGCWRIRSLRRAGGNCETRILGVGGEECVLTELKHRGRRVVDLGYKRSLSLVWVMDFGYRRL